MSANFEAKKVTVEEIKDKIQRAKSITIVDYSGINVEQDTKMRRAFKAIGAEYKVYKNRLMALALSELGVSGTEEYFQGLSAVAFSYNDEVAAPKVIVETIKRIKKPAIKFGILDGRLVQKEAIETLAELPSKEILIAKLLGTLLAPATNLASVLSAPARGLAVALNAIANKN